MRLLRSLAAGSILLSVMVLPSAAGAASSSAWVSAGYMFSVAAPHPALTVSFVNAQVSLPVRCSANGPVAGTVTVPLSAGPYSVPANDASTYPSANDGAASTYQGGVQMPNLCGSGPMYLYYGNGVGATFSADLQSSDTTDPFTMRFHFRIPAASGYGNIDCGNASENPGPDGSRACQGPFSISTTSVADPVSPTPAPVTPEAGWSVLFPVSGAVVISVMVLTVRRRQKRAA